MRKTLLAIPKNCRLDELIGLMQRAGIASDPPIPKGGSRRIRFATNHLDLDILLVKNWDAIPLVELAAIDLALIGSDLVMELASEAVPLLDLNVGRCRLSLAAPSRVALAAFPPAGRLRVVTSYPTITSRYLQGLDVQADFVILRGGVEVAPSLGLGDWIVDIVATGGTLRAHGLVEVRQIAEIGAQLVASKAYLQHRPADAARWVETFGSAVARSRGGG